MSIAETWGPYCAEIMHESFMADTQDAYRTILTADGVMFSDETTRHTIQQWDADVAMRRGRVYLRPDGTMVDMTGFERSSAKKILQEHRPELVNEERLRSLVDMSLLSKAGSYAVVKAMHETPAEVEDRKNMQTLFKRYVQMGIATEEWGAPWQRLVAEGFEGESVQFPLASSRDVAQGLSVLSLAVFDPLRQHFPLLPRFCMSVFNEIHAMPTCQQLPSDDVSPSIAARVSIFYRHSAAASDALVGDLVGLGQLTGAIDWQAELPSIIDRRAIIFDTRTR